MRMRCQCPHCGVALRMRLTTRSPEEFRFESEDVVAVAMGDAEDEGLPIIVLYTDLPVHQSLLAGPASHSGSAFLTWVTLWGDRAEEYVQRADILQHMRIHLFPEVRRAASLYSSNDLPRLSDAIAKLDAQKRVPELSRFHPVYQLGRIIDALHLPFVDLAARTAAVNEFLTDMVACHRTTEHEYRALLDLFVEELGFIEHRRQVVETAFAVLDRVDALLPGLAWEHLTVTPRPSEDEFRIVRDDFNELRSLYVDIFEVASRTLAYVGAVVNLSRRKAPTAWSSKSTAEIRGMLGRKASEREFILDDLPMGRQFYDGLKRHSRNEFGHYNVEYDFSSGELVGKGGRRTNYLLFLVDYLAAARLTAYLLSVVEKLSLDYLNADSYHRAVAKVEE